MALFKILKGSSENFGKSDNKTSKTVNGYAYFTPDDGKFYIDITDGDFPIVGSSSSEGANRICINNDWFAIDCGTAGGVEPVNIREVFISGSSADSELTEETLVLIAGGSQDTSLSSDTILYICGSSKE